MGNQGNYISRNDHSLSRGDGRGRGRNCVSCFGQGEEHVWWCIVMPTEPRATSNTAYSLYPFQWHRLQWHSKAYCLLCHLSKFPVSGVTIMTKYSTRRLSSGGSPGKWRRTLKASLPPIIGRKHKFFMMIWRGTFHSTRRSMWKMRRDTDVHILPRMITLRGIVSLSCSGQWKEREMLIMAVLIQWIWYATA